MRPYNRLMAFIFMTALTIPLLAAGGAAAQTSATVETSAWGSTPGLTEPHPDSKGRAGYWWWPKPEAGAEPQERIAGNRGRVYGAWNLVVTVGCPEGPHPPPEPPRYYGDPIVCGGVVLNNILFDFDKAILKAEGKAEINKLIAEMNKFQGDTLVCIGHTDDVGSEAYNLQLGERRAQAVKDYMVEQGIAEYRIGIKSLGETMPAVPNDTPQNRALNRLVEFEITLGN